jgi:hypothetical protein
MTTKEAEANLNQLLDTAVARGIIANAEGVIVSRASIDYLVQSLEGAAMGHRQLLDRVKYLEDKLKARDEIPGIRQED